MSWLLVLGTAWALLSAPLALLVGRSIRCADQAVVACREPAVPDFVPAEWSAFPTGSR
jgi:hypothetical protein